MRCDAVCRNYASQLCLNLTFAIHRHKRDDCPSMQRITLLPAISSIIPPSIISCPSIGGMRHIKKIYEKRRCVYASTTHCSAIHKWRLALNTKPKIKPILFTTLITPPDNVLRNIFYYHNGSFVHLIEDNKCDGLTGFTVHCLFY